MKKYLFSILIFFLTISTSAQTDSLQNKILNYTDTTLQIIIKGRGLLAEKFMEGDYQKVKEIKDYLLAKVRDKNYMVFYEMERQYILYWTQEYNELLRRISIQDSLNNNSNRANRYFDDLSFERISIPDDLLFDKLYKKSKDSIVELNAFIDQASLKGEDKAYLKLRLQYLLSMVNYRSGTRDSLNASADAFLEKFPSSRYNPFIRKYIRHKFEPSKWAFVFEFFSGYGILTKELNSTFTNPVPIGVAFDIYYKNVVLYLRDYIGLNKTKNAVPYNNGVWEKGMQARTYLPEASLGYVLMDNKLVKLAPFAGISGTAFLPTDHDEEKNPDLENAGLKFTTSFTTGINLDFKFGIGKTGMGAYQEESYGFIRLRYGFNPSPFEKRYSGYSGSMHYITLGVGGFSRSIKRKY